MLNKLLKFYIYSRERNQERNFDKVIIIILWFDLLEVSQHSVIKVHELYVSVNNMFPRAPTYS